MARRALWLAFLGGGVAGAVAWVRNRDDRSAPSTPEWPPLVPVDGSTSETSRATGGATGNAAGAASVVNALVDAPDVRSTSSDWVAPLDDGTCPLSHPVKANDNSGIYHVPGGRFYERTNAERCYASADAAAADGYRAAKA